MGTVVGVLAERAEVSPPVCLFGWLLLLRLLPQHPQPLNATGDEDNPDTGHAAPNPDGLQEGRHMQVKMVELQEPRHGDADIKRAVGDETEIAREFLLFRRYRHSE